MGRISPFNVALTAAWLSLGCISSPSPEPELTFAEEGIWVLDTTFATLTNPSMEERNLARDFTSNFTTGAISVLEIEIDELAIPKDVWLRIVGTRPIHFLTDVAIIEGVIDAGSRQSTVYLGAGAHTGDCSSWVDADEDDNVSAAAGGGGGGGSFEGNGGEGGSGDSDGAKGAVAGLIQPFEGSLRGGCFGGHSGSLAGDGRDAGGPGGGAIRIDAARRIDVSGHISASGGGGAGGRAQSGGGGGGSGGMVWLETPQLSVANTATITARGGGGGEGGDVAASECAVGADGADGFTLLMDIGEGAAGGATSGCPAGGDGGNGSHGQFGNPGDGAPGGASQGGGGGGGAPGFILVVADSAEIPSDSVSPPPLTPDEAINL